MKLLRFLYKNTVRWGALGESSVDLLESAPYESIKKSARHISLKELSLCIPAEPTKIILTGLNYRDHAKEMNLKIPDEPIIFLKPVSSCIAHNGAIVYPKGVKRLDYEAELAVVVKKRGKNIKKTEALDYILGFTCLNDVTARDLQSKDGQWTRAKSFDTFCPIGPWVETEFDPRNAAIRLYLNGILRQHSNTKNFIFSLAYLISFISNVMTIVPGDVISTGTPSGIGPMDKNDEVCVDIEGIGTLYNYVI